ncbi:uncharacterized protein LOC130903680 [Diorhabda carinulata]|uniref:uncharacterized protein LOC130903680 n=1 Tax=Diorhabda carinulata TaxID=1163345 RepID=UPI0025A1A03A|nr:uncharacterized protein LOC130903680 [Diorhabda carinulata]
MTNSAIIETVAELNERSDDDDENSIVSDFKKAFDKEKFLLQTFGVYPLVDPKIRFQRLRCFLCYSINVLNLCLTMMLPFVNDMKKFLDASHFIVISFTFLCKFPLFVFSKVMKSIENHINSIDVANIPMEIMEHVKKEENRRSWIYFPQRYAVLGNLVHILFSCLRHSNERTLVLISWSPFNLQDPKYYYSTLVFQSIAYLASGLPNGSIDITYYILVDIACCQMDILVFNLANLDNSKGDIQLYRNLNKNILNHIEIIRNFHKMYSTLIFVQCIGSVMVICVLGFQLSVTSERVTEACYLSKWYEFDFKVKKSLLILMTRCSKAIVLSAGIFDLTLETFTMILRTSYSYMAVIRTVFGDYMTKKQSTP